MKLVTEIIEIATKVRIYYDSEKPKSRKQAIRDALRGNTDAFTASSSGCYGCKRLNVNSRLIGENLPKKSRKIKIKIPEALRFYEVVLADGDSKPVTVHVFSDGTHQLQKGASQDRFRRMMCFYHEEDAPKYVTEWAARMCAKLGIYGVS